MTASSAEWVIRNSVDAAVEEFCARLEQRLTQARAAAGPLAVALTGGSTARAFYSGWAACYRDRRSAVWQPQALEFYWSDERIVPADDPDSNYRLARETLLEPAAIPAALIHRVPTEQPEPAARYADLIRERVPAGAVGRPQFPILILGMGADGHTASLFPHTDILLQDQALVRRAAGTPDHPHDRVTFTPALLNAAREVWFLISGATKADAVLAVYQRQASARQIPALVVDPSQTAVTYFVAGDAAARLPPRPSPR